MLVAQLVAAGDVVQQAGGDDHVRVCPGLCTGDVQRYAQYAVDVLAIVRAVGIAHALAHIGIQEGIPFAFHVPAP